MPPESSSSSCVHSLAVHDPRTLEDAVVDDDVGALLRTALGEIQTLPWDVTLLVFPARHRGVAAAARVASDRARYRDFERHVQPNGQVPRRLQLGPQQKHAVEQ